MSGVPYYLADASGRRLLLPDGETLIVLYYGLPTGKVCAGFDGSGPEVAYSIKEPGITSSGQGPGMIVSGKGPSVTADGKGPGVALSTGDCDA